MFLKKAVSLVILVSLMISLLSGIVPANATGSLSLSGKVIILDAGHGVATDNRVGLYSEHTTMLALARRVKPLLESLGATVYMTRDSNATVPLQSASAMINIWALEAVRSTRTNSSEIAEINRLIALMQGIINEPIAEGYRLMNLPYTSTRTIHPDLRRIFELQNDPIIRNNFLVISLHSNAASSTTIRGAEAYYISPTENRNSGLYFSGYSHSAQSKAFGDMILNHINNAGIPRRTFGLRAENYSIIREINVPGVLVENGFHTNETDRNLLLNPDFLERLAWAYHNAVAEFFGASGSGQQTTTESIFSDVPRNSVAYDAIHWAQANGIVTGQAGRFYPSDNITRAAFALVLWRYDGYPSTGERAGFTDVPASHIAHDAIMWAQANGIVTGQAGRFFPSDSITRQAMVLMLYRYHILNGGAASTNNNAIAAFSDRGRITPIAVDAMNWAVTHGLMTGADGRLYPEDPITRAAVVLVLYRYMNTFGGSAVAQAAELIDALTEETSATNPEQ